MENKKGYKMRSSGERQFSRLAENAGSSGKVVCLRRSRGSSTIAYFSKLIIALKMPLFPELDKVLVPTLHIHAFSV